MFSSEPRSLRLGLASLALGLALLAGCSPHIGDKCTVSTDCSATGDRLCDITEPGGYCTQFNCEPDGCPDGAACINFGTTLSVGDPNTVPAACQASQGNSPYMRSFCLASCESDGDCRADYACVEPETIGGVKSDYDSARRGKVCAVARTTIDPSALPEPNSDQVCIGSDGGLSMSSGGASGAGGMSSGGEGGAAGDAAGGISGADSAGAGG